MIRRMIERPIAATMVMIAVVVLGIVAAGKLPISLMPEVDIPQITIRINAPNKSARELQASISGLLEQLKQTNHLKEIRSESKDGSAIIFMQFEYGKSIDYIFIDVNEQVDRARNSLGNDIPAPVVVKASATDIPAFYLNLTLKNSSTDSHSDLARDNKLIELSDFAASVIAKRLEQLKQVAFVDITGRLYPEIIIEPETEKLAALSKDFSIIEQAIKNANINLGNLVVRDGQYQYNIRFDSRISDKRDIENIPLNIDGKIYLLKDLAQVKVRPQARQEYVRSDGEEAISMAVIKQSDARMGDLREEIDNLIVYMERDYPEIKFTVTRDQTELLNYSIGNLEENLVIGAILACFILFLFMQDLRTPFLITLTIPLSLLVSLLLFYVIGVSINIISLSGLMLGLGMMVDNSIIVIDNISQRWDRGDPIKEAVVKGGEEVFGALLSSVLTTCAIFIPLIFLGGIAGAMFYDQAVGVSVGLISSLVVAFTVIPVYYYMMYRRSEKRVINRFIAKFGIPDMGKAYEKSLKWVFRHQVLVWSILLVIMTAGIYIFPKLEKRMLPEVGKDDMVIYVNWNTRINPAENDARVTKMMSQVQENLHQYTSMAGKHQFILSHTAEINSNEALVYFKVKEQDELEKTFQRAADFIKHTYPEAIVEGRDAGNIFEMIFSDNDPMLVARLRPRNNKPAEPDKLNPLLASIAAELPGIYIEPVAWQENITLYADRQLMALYKVDFNTLHSVFMAAFNEHEIHTINQGQYSLSVKIGEKDNTIQDILAHKTVRSTDEIDIPLNLLILESQDRDLRSIVSGHEGNFYPLNLNISEGQVSQVQNTIAKIVGEHPEFEVGFSGAYFDSRDTMKQLAVILIVSLLLLYFILASQFESMVQPFIILSEIAVDIAGALFFLWIFGTSLNLMSMIGIIVMCGIVINDSILKVDTINKIRKHEGYSTLRAVITGGDRRLKPIIMTALATILAIVPFLFSGGMGNDLQRPLSLSIIGGMIIGTVVSIDCIPLLYYYIYRKNNGRKGR